MPCGIVAGMPHERERELGAGERTGPGHAAAGAPGGLRLRALQGSIGNAAIQRAVAARRPVAFPHGARLAAALPASQQLSAVHDPSACEERATAAFTDGGVTHFASETPDLHVAAHEAAHQLQHAGLTRDAGLGAEGHANAVADAVVAGEPPAPLLSADGERVAPAIRHYTTTDALGVWGPGKSDKGSGRLADTGETWTDMTHRAFAADGLLTKANDVLRTRKSGVELVAGGETMSVQSPDGSPAKTLRSVMPKIAAGNNLTMPGDCREAAEEIMGPKGTTHDASNVASTPGGQRSEFPVTASAAGDLIAKTIYVDQRVKDTPGFDGMSQADKDEVLKKARADYDALDVKEKQKLRASPVAQERAKQLGIDQYTAPAVGEAFVVVPGTHDPLGYMYHYAAVIMAPGEDRVTMENEGTRPGVRDDHWKIDTYGTGSKEGQSFDEQHAAIKGSGHTVKVRAGAPPPEYAADIPKMTTQDLLKKFDAAATLDEREYLLEELAKRSIVIDVAVEKQEDYTGKDDVFAVVTGGGKPHTTAWVAIKEGSSGTITLPVASVMPIGKSLSFEMKEHDAIDPDDSIGTFTWGAPYDPSPAQKVSGDDAIYNVSVSFGAPAAPAK